MPASPKYLLSPLAGSLLALAACAAQAEGTPYYAGVSEVITHDNNLERGRPGSTLISDTYFATGVRLGLDQPIGRQRVLASLDANRNTYRSQGRFNHTDYRLLSRLEWSTIENVSGTLSAEATRRLDRDDAANTRVFAGRNLVNGQSLNATARVGLHSTLAIDAGLSASRSRYEVVPSRNLRQTTAGGGVTLQPGSGLQLRAGLRATQANFPNLAGGDPTRRRDLDLSANVEASGASSLFARLSRTRETHDAQAQRDLSAWTGSLGWNWRPSGKLSLTTTYSRDSSIGNNAVDTGLVAFDTSDTRLRTTLALRAQWELTGKLSLGAGASTSRRTLDNAFTAGALATVNSAADRTQTWDLSLRYLPTRNVELGCSVRWEDRSVDDPSTTITSPYSATVLSCSGQLYWR